MFLVPRNFIAYFNRYSFFLQNFPHFATKNGEVAKIYCFFSPICFLLHLNPFIKIKMQLLWCHQNLNTSGWTAINQFRA